MKRIVFGPVLLSVALLLGTSCTTQKVTQRAQANTDKGASSPYDRSAHHPYGQRNLEAPPETAQYDFMVGTFDCKLTYKAYQDGEWVVRQEGHATWRAWYIMDGYALLDAFYDEWGDTNINVRVFDEENSKWLIHYTTVKPARSALYEGRYVDGKMVMLVDRETPGGFAYTDRIAFESQTPDAYRWTQEIVYSDTSSVLIGDILCQRR